MSEVLLNIKGRQTHGDQSGDVELTTEGTFTMENGVFVISYDESESEGEDVRTEIRVADGMVTMHKSGAVETEFIFEKGKTFVTNYQTPFGNLDVSLLPTLVEAKLQDACGSIELEYVMSIAGAQIVNRLNLRYTADKSAPGFGC
jgi:uncharacterized beta-barrel protein YwiB (DUF1934 family)